MEDNKNINLNAGTQLNDDTLEGIAGGYGELKDQCPYCKNFFPTANKHEREIFRQHKLQCQKSHEYSPFKG